MNDEIFIDGFSKTFRNDRNSYGVVIIYLTNSLYAVGRLDLDLANMECIWIEISDPTSKFFICCVYRPTNSDILVSFWKKVEWSIKKAHELSDKIIILGDFNVHNYVIPITHNQSTLLIT